MSRFLNMKDLCLSSSSRCKATHSEKPFLVAGPFFKIGPKLFLGSPKKCATIELQYFQFGEHNGVTFHGLALGTGLAIMSNNGFFFHPKIEYQYSPSKEKTKYPAPSLSNLEIALGLGYSFCLRQIDL